MHQIVSAPVDSSRRWWVLAIVVAAQFMFGVDAFIVNVAIPTIAAELQATPVQIEFMPLALSFVVASRQSAARVRHRGTLVLVEGCVIQIVGLAALVLTLSIVSTPTALLLALVLTIFGYGQGLVMAPLSSAVLSTVRPASAGSG